MFDFSFGELLLIGLVAVLIVGPRDMPVVLRAVGRWAGQFRGVVDEFKQGFRSALEDSPLEDVKKELHDIHEDVQFIRDENGNLQPVYDISDFLDERERAKKQQSS